jgi:hypothetical protein
MDDELPSLRTDAEVEVALERDADERRNRVSKLPGELGCSICRSLLGNDRKRPHATADDGESVRGSHSSELSSVRFSPVEVEKPRPASCREKSETNRRQKFFAVKWLGQKGRGPGVQSRRTHPRVVVGGEYNHPGRRRDFAQSRLNVEAVHDRHPDIDHGKR